MLFSFQWLTIKNCWNYSCKYLQIFCTYRSVWPITKTIHHEIEFHADTLSGLLFRIFLEDFVSINARTKDGNDERGLYLLSKEYRPMSVKVPKWILSWQFNCCHYRAWSLRFDQRYCLWNCEKGSNPLLQGADCEGFLINLGPYSNNFDNSGEIPYI